MRLKVILTALTVVFMTSCHVGRFFYWNFAGINDVEKFESRPIKTDNGSIAFIRKSLDFEKEISTIEFEKGFEKGLEDSKTVAFLVLKNDTLVYEKYMNGYEDTTLMTSFSVAKSFISSLVGIAVKEGFIKNTGQSIGEFIPSIKDSNVRNVSIEDVLNMRTGIEYNEGYFNPFGDVAVSYYGTDLQKHVDKLKLKDNPGSKFKYISVNTQILSMVLENATGKSLNEYAQEKLWKPMQMEFNGSWSVDSKTNQVEKAFCCWNARGRDYLRYGKLMLNKGNWNGKQLVPLEWTDKVLNPDKHGFEKFYSYQWWHGVVHTHKETKKTYVGTEVFKLFLMGDFGNAEKYDITSVGDSYAQGILGQYIYIHPEKDLVIVRIGKKTGGVNWPRVFSDIGNQLK